MPGPWSEARWRAIDPHLERALDLSGETRAAWLAKLRSENAELAADIEALLAEQALLDAEGFLGGTPTALIAPHVSAGQEVGAYTLRAPIGEGGMGTVWRAERSDGRFEGVVAIKLLHASSVGSTGADRFKREGEILARVRHPNIAQLLDAGVLPTGQPYLVLEHVDGVPIDVHCETRALGLSARIHLFLDVLGAVAHAHANLIVHRDIKPSNVFVSRDGTVKLLDFGIAKLIAESSAWENTLSRSGGSPLTPAFAAPEQVTQGLITTATDVYALGVLLYLLLTGRHPAGDAVRSPAQLYQAIIENRPRRMSETEAGAVARRQLRGDLDTIVGKALKKPPAERYPTVNAFSDDLRHWLRHEPISARPDSLVYRTTKLVRRHRVAAALLGTLLVTLAAGMIGTFTQSRRARAEAVAASAERRRADEHARSAGVERDFAIRQLWRAEAFNKLNSFLMLDARRWGTVVTPDDLLARAEHMLPTEGARDESRIELLVNLGLAYQRGHDESKARQLLDRAFELAKEVPTSPAAAKSACALAEVLVGSDPTRAEALLTEAERALPVEARLAPVRIFCLTRGREVAVARGDHALALSRIETAHRLFRQAGVPALDFEFELTTALAITYDYNGRPQAAVELLSQFVPRVDAPGMPPSLRLAGLLNSWGLNKQQLGLHLEAEPLLRRAGVNDVFNPPIQYNLARSLYELGRLEEAAEVTREAVRQVNTSGRNGVLGNIRVLEAALARHRGDLDAAAKLVDEGENHMRNFQEPSFVGFAGAASERALQAQTRGDLPLARKEADRAVAIANASLRGRGGYRPYYLRRRAELAIAEGHFDAAAEDARAAVAGMQAVAPAGAHSSEIGLAALALGQAQAGQGRNQAAQAAFKLAFEHLAPALGEEHPATRNARRLAAR